MENLKTVTLDIVKKNRVYFKCLTTNGYEVKLKVTPESENLPLGKQDLLVEDVSVRTKYGTDVIYQLKAEVKNEGIVTFSHRYNSVLVEKCKNLGGRWDESAKVWVFPKILEEQIEELEYLYNADIVWVEITAKDRVFAHNGPVKFLGYKLAQAWDRDSGAQTCENVSMIEGSIDSGGSAKNWGTVVHDGTKFRLQISKNLIQEECEKWDVKILENN